MSFGEILTFDAEQIREIFEVCLGQQTACTDLGGHVKKLSDLHTWAGDAAAAAKNAAGKTRVDLDSHGREVWKLAAAARGCYQEGIALKRSAQTVQADADQRGLVIDPATGAVTDPHPPTMKGWAQADKQSYYSAIAAIQNRVNEVISAAVRFDDDLAAAINAADGSIPLTPNGEADNVNLADRRANQIAAFRQMYNRNPLSENDWRMAQVLDPHCYTPKTKGVLSTLTVGEFTPQPGRGVVTLNAFIPRDKVFNLGSDDLGDMRGFDPYAAPESSRATIYIDYEHGLVVARQNPSVAESGEVRVGSPHVSASEGPDGQLNLKYDFTNPLVPGGETPAHLMRETVRGAIAIPGGGQPPTVNGVMSNYPAVEVYSFPTNTSEPSTIYQYMPGGRSTVGAESAYGPLLNLPTERTVGDDSLYPQRHSAPYMVNDPYSIKPPPVLLDGTPLGSRSAPSQLESMH